MELCDLFETTVDKLIDNFIILDDRKIKLLVECDSIVISSRRILGIMDTSVIEIIVLFMNDIINHDDIPIYRVESPQNKDCVLILKFLTRKINEWIKNQIPIKKTFLVDLYSFVERKIIFLMEYCIVCDKKLDFSGLKPTCCYDSKCIFAYEEMGLGVDPISELRVNPEISELLIIIASTSLKRCTSIRNQKIWNSIPTHFYNDSGRKNSFDRMEESFNLLNDNTIFDIIDKNDFSTKSDLYQLIKFIFNFNRAGLTIISDNDKLKVMNTKHQYYLTMHNSSHESNFIKLKEKYGSEYVWHGTSIYNLQHIIQFGLKNYSNTSMMSSGAAYGSGIYFSKKSSVSGNYSLPIITDIKTKYFDDVIKCIFYCEVVNLNLFKRGEYYVVPDQNYVNVRMIFVYDNKPIPLVDSDNIL